MRHILYVLLLISLHFKNKKGRNINGHDGGEEEKRALYASLEISSDVLRQWNVYFMEYNWESLPIFLPVVLYYV